METFRTANAIIVGSKSVPIIFVPVVEELLQSTLAAMVPKKTKLQTPLISVDT